MQVVSDIVFLRPFWGLAMFIVLIALAIFDLRERILPNELNLLLGLIGILQSLFTGSPTLLDAVLGSVLYGGILTSIALMFRRIRGIDGLGLGDQKFGVAAGVCVGWQQVPLSLSVAAVAALLFIGVRTWRTGQFDRDEATPFGPFLSAGVFVAWLNSTSL
jgi:leader peptidase (prepilin peptidase)/N-methyltransferase